jgi:hypothetical protein
MHNSEATKGEGHAMGYCLLSIGAETPNEMSKVQAVCIHRTFALENIEGLYVELTNLASHTVEFFHFGQGLPMEPIFSTGASSSFLTSSCKVDPFLHQQAIMSSSLAPLFNKALLSSVSVSA